MGKTLRDIANFTQDDLLKLRAARKIATDILPALDEAEECGNDCRSFRDAFRAMDLNLANIERLAMPSAVPPGHANAAT